MVNPDPEDAEEKPLDPAMAKVQAKLQRLMLIAGLTLGFGIFAVLLAVVYRITVMDDKAPAEAVAVGPRPPAVVETAAPAAPAGSQSPQPSRPIAPPPADAPAPSAPSTDVPPQPYPEPKPAEVEEALRAAEATIPADARLVASTVAGGKIVLTYDHFAGTLVILVDPETLEVVGRLRMTPE